MNDWLTREEAGKALGVHPATVNKMARRGTNLPKGVTEIEHNGGRGPHSLWRIVWESDTDSGTSGEDDQGRPSASGIVDMGTYHIVHDDEGERYVFGLPSHGRPFVRSREWVERVWRRYTDGAQINEVAREFGIDRQTFVDLKQALGLTKTSGPFTDQELNERDEEELVDDALRAKERRILTRAEAASWRATKRDADLVHRQREWVRDVVAEVEWSPPRVPNLAARRRDHAVLVGLSDWHVGKRSAGGDHTLASQVEGLTRHLDDVCDRALSVWGTPHRAIVMMGSDLLHVDTMDQTTTRGTPQGAQSVGSSRQAWRAALRLMDRAVQSLASACDVTVVVVPGNHDRLSAYTLGTALELRWDGLADFHVPHDDCDRQIVPYCDVPIMMTHGDQERPADLPLLLAREMPRGCDLRRGVIVSGHLHRNARAEEDKTGVQLVTLRSPACADDWHAAKGYVGAQRGTTLLRIDPGVGLGGVEYVRT